MGKPTSIRRFNGPFGVVSPGRTETLGKVARGGNSRLGEGEYMSILFSPNLHHVDVALDWGQLAPTAG